MLIRKNKVPIPCRYSTNEFNIVVFSDAFLTLSFMGHEATGKEVLIDVMDIARIEHGQLIEHWGIPDRFAFLLQLGILPSPVSGT